MVTAEVTERQAHRGAEAAAQRRRGSEVVSGRELTISSRATRTCSRLAAIKRSLSSLLRRSHRSFANG